MSALVKYELKKILKNKLCFGVIILVFIGSLALCGYQISQYKAGIRGEYTLSDMNGRKMPEIVVSQDNIKELEQKLEAFESRDDIYTTMEEVMEGLQYVDGVARMPMDMTYHGKYEIDMTELHQKLERGEITEKEFEDLMYKSSDMPIIKPEYYSDYFAVYAPVKDFRDQVMAIEQLEYEASKVEGTDASLMYLEKAEAIENALGEGYVYGYDYGWESAFDSFSSGTLSLLLVAVVLLGTCTVFSSEYSQGTDALIIAARRGRKMTVSAKIIASCIYSLICAVAFTVIVFGVNFAFLGVEGANVGVEISNIDRLLSVFPFIALGCILLSFISLAASVVFKKTVTASFVSLLSGFFPVVLYFYVLVEDPLETMLKLTPALMICGSYVSYQEFIVINQNAIDITVFFLPVAVFIGTVALPVIYGVFCRHQIKN